MNANSIRRSEYLAIPYMLDEQEENSLIKNHQWVLPDLVMSTEVHNVHCVRESMWTAERLSFNNIAIQCRGRGDVEESGNECVSASEDLARVSTYFYCNRLALLARSKNKMVSRTYRGILLHRRTEVRFLQSTNTPSAGAATRCSIRYSDNPRKLQFLAQTRPNSAPKS